MLNQLHFCKHTHTYTHRHTIHLITMSYSLSRYLDPLVPKIRIFPFQSDALSLRRCRHQNLFTPKVPEGSHMEGHVGEHDQVLTQSEECVNSWFTILIVAPEEVARQ